MNSSRRGFTLIELLIVIAIIGILMALLFPAVQSAIESARRTQAKNDVTQIATAVVAYTTEYGKLPSTNGGGSATPLDSSIVPILAGSNINSANPRQLVFLEVPNYKKGKGGQNAAGNYQDPWNHTYKIYFDSDYDNVITISGTAIRKTVVVTTDTNGAYDDGASGTKVARRYVTSFD